MHIRSQRKAYIKFGLLALTRVSLQRKLNRLWHLQAEWTTLFGVLALVARHDPRKRVADAASNSLLNIVKTRSSSSWNQDLWFMFWEHGVQYALDLPSYSGSFKSDNRPVSLLFNLVYPEWSEKTLWNCILTLILTRCRRIHGNYAHIWDGGPLCIANNR